MLAGLWAVDVFRPSFQAEIGRLKSNLNALELEVLPR